MEGWLNTVGLGNGGHGAKAASLEFFKKSAIKINKQQAATLAVVLPSPLNYNAKKPTNYLNRRINWTMKQMRYWGGKLDYEKEDKIENKYP